jgi:pyocin large subunit-like protein
LRFLTRKGDAEAVGRFYRDLQILESVQKPAEYARKKHVRSWVETGNSRLDNRGMSNRVKHASSKQAERDSYWTSHALQVEALVGLMVK